MKLFKKLLLISVVVHFFFNGSELQAIPNIIKSVQIHKNTIKVSVNESFKKEWLRDDFFVEYGSDINLEKIPYSIALLPFTLNIHAIVWISGKDYSIDCMDEDIYYSLEKIKKVIQRIHPNTAFNGNLIPKKLVKNRLAVDPIDSKRSIALLFSHGLDSVGLSFDLHDKKQLLISAHGHDDLPVNDFKFWELEKARFMKYAHDYGHKNAFFRSNYTEFVQRGKLDHKVSPDITGWKLDTTEGVGLFGITAPILFTKGYTELHIASSLTWSAPYATASTPLVDGHVLLAGSIRLRHGHFDKTRFAKIKLIVDLVKRKNIKRPYLKVCKHNNSLTKKKSLVNCSVNCSKCRLTAISLIALGEDHSLYGFNHTPKEICRATEEDFFQNQQSPWSAWNFLDIQHKLKLMKKVPAKLHWILDINFKKLDLTKYYGTRPRVNWNDFRDIAPHDLTIPKNYVKDLPLPYKERPSGSSLYDNHEKPHTNFINRWSFQKLCNHVFDPSVKNEIPTTLKRGGATFDPSDVKAGDIIFVRKVDKFMKTMHNKITVPYIMVSHGDFRDTTLNEQLRYLNDEKVIAWFSAHPPQQSHPKYFPLPLGVNQTGKIKERCLDQEKTNNLFRKLRNSSKRKLATGFFAVSGLHERKDMKSFCKNRPYCSIAQKKLPFKEYLKGMASSVFTFSPRGLGPDCYRTWEALLVGTIPIVKRGQHDISTYGKQRLVAFFNGDDISKLEKAHLKDPFSKDSSYARVSSATPTQLDKLYENLPVLVIDDWDQITEAFLKRKYKEITSKKYDLSILYTDYWHKKILDVQKEYLKNYQPTPSSKLKKATSSNKLKKATPSNKLKKTPPSNKLQELLRHKTSVNILRVAAGVEC